MRKWRVLVGMILGIALSGCDEKPTYTYAWYMQHPVSLKQILMACATENQKSSERAAQCKMAMYAAENMQSLIDAMQSNPELFGQRILAAQMTYAASQKTAAEAQVVLDALQTQQASAAQLRTAQDDLYKATKASADQAEQIQILLAVAGLSAPD